MISPGSAESPDELEEIASAGPMLVAARSQLSQYVGIRREAIINRLISEYRGGKLNEHLAWGLAGELAVLEGLLNDLERGIRSARAATHKMLGDGKAT